jgi:hypothetical protein
MSDKELLKRQIKNHYIDIFLKRGIDDCRKLDTNDYPDGYTDIRYLSYAEPNGDGYIRFSIKKRIFKLQLIVEIFTNTNKKGFGDPHLLQTSSITLYYDLFYLKKKNKLKDKILKIINKCDYDEILKSVNGDVTFLRKMKLEKLKSKI